MAHASRPMPIAAALLVLLAAGCGGHSKSGSTSSGAQSAYKLSSRLTNAQAVPKPKNAKNGSGTFSGTVSISGQSGTINWKLKTTGLNGKATSAQIFLGGPRRIGLAAVDLCAPCAPNAHGTLGANTPLLDALVSRPIYVNVRTKKNPHGEIRGRVVVKPSKS
jgi:hypothetical protein